MISEELLSTILGAGVTRVVHYPKDSNLYYSFTGTDTQHINIYELAHKCKEWAMSQGFIVLTYGEAYYNVDVHYHSNKSKFGNLAFSDTAQEEPEAIFKACQWILEQNDNK